MSKADCTRQIINEIGKANRKGLSKEDIEGAKIGLIADIALSLSEIVDYLRKGETDKGGEAE